MISFEGTCKEFHDHFGPKVRSRIASMTKSVKNTLGNRCQRCGNVAPSLDAAHRHGLDRKTLVCKALEKYPKNGDRYVIDDLDKIFAEIEQLHTPINDVFMFLCRSCHKEYDDFGKQYDTLCETLKTFEMYLKEYDDFGKQYDTKKPAKPSTGVDLTTMAQKSVLENPILHKDAKYSSISETFKELLQTRASLRPCLLELFQKFPDETVSSTYLRRIYENLFPNENIQKMPNYLHGLKRDGFLENTGRGQYRLKKRSNDKLPKLPSMQNLQTEWDSKILRTSLNNRKNIEELISAIDLKFECLGHKVNKWYYHDCKKNNRQFSGIICHKNKPEIRFRINPNSFDIRDKRINHKPEWFFQYFEERSIDIMSENFELIMACLKYAYEYTLTFDYFLPKRMRNLNSESDEKYS